MADPPAAPLNVPAPLAAGIQGVLRDYRSPLGTTRSSDGKTMRGDTYEAPPLLPPFRHAELPLLCTSIGVEYAGVPVESTTWNPLRRQRYAVLFPHLHIPRLPSWPRKSRLAPRASQLSSRTHMFVPPVTLTVQVMGLDWASGNCTSGTAPVCPFGMTET